MKIPLKKFVKAFLPYGIIVLYREYKKYHKHYKKSNIQKEFVFDIIFSVGIACRPAHYLKEYGLRVSANPLDWMMAYSLDTVIHLYKTKFEDFFVDYVEDKEKSLEHNCHWYVDIKNNIISMHYDNVKNNNTVFRNLMRVRFKRINELLVSANRICFLSNRNDDINVQKRFLIEMGEIYTGEITYMNIRNNNNIRPLTAFKYFEKKISDRLKLVEFNLNDIHPKGEKNNSDAWIGNYVIWDTIMEKISLKNKMNFISYLFKNMENK
jgi:hypothetical protein